MSLEALDKPVGQPQLVVLALIEYTNNQLQLAGKLQCIDLLAKTSECYLREALLTNRMGGYLTADVVVEHLNQTQLKRLRLQHSRTPYGA